MAVTHNFTIEQGSDFSITFIYQDNDGNLIDISDGAIAFRFRPNNSDTVQTFTRADVDNDYVTSGGIGEIKISFPAETTQEFDFINAIYDLDFQPNVTSGLQTNTRIATGIITLITKNFNTFVGIDDTGGGDTTTNPNESSASSGYGDGDQCADALSCIQLDSLSVVYTSGSMNIYDNQDNSGTINVDDIRTIDRMEIVVNNLKHESPQDLTFLLSTPTTDTLLLSSNSKINNYDPDVDTDGFSFIFSNRAASNIYLNNVTHNGFCRIKDKTDIVKYSSETLISDINEIRGSGASGDYTLYINDNDTGGSGSIASWNLILTYV